jgi:outer membrane protein OmpA-like peptidoglycan-associated protein
MIIKSPVGTLLLFLGLLLSCHQVVLAQKSNLGSVNKNEKALASNQPNSIKLLNSSFEDEPEISKTPFMWKNCGDPAESAPDVQPSGWMVDRPAFDGRTYLGMVVRDNDTWESVGQKLQKPLEANKCYEFSIYLSKSATYISQSHRTKRDANYTTPIKLRIWAGDDYCAKKQLLAESSLVTNSRWIKYDFVFRPKHTMQYFILEAFFNTPTLVPYNGNLLLDNASLITEIPCNKRTESTIAQNTDTADNKSSRNDKPNNNLVVAKPREKNTVASEQLRQQNKPVQGNKKEPKILIELDRNKIKEGQTIGIDKLYFLADSSKITLESYPVLDEIVNFLKDNSNVSIEVGGHTNNIPTDDYCDKLSTNRAKAVADYLISKGLATDRILFKGYGKRNPIATNNTLDGRKKNQRVEIKILSIRNK